MSSIEPWFFNDSSLKFLATVKSVNVLWRHSKVSEDIEEFFTNFVPSEDSSNPSITTLRHSITQKFEDFVRKLMLPKTIENDLSVFFWQIHKPVFSFLQSTLTTIVVNGVDPDIGTKISRFMNQLKWNDIGGFDDRGVIESQISDVATINYYCWVKLCEYCCEDYLHKFSDSVDWSGSRFESNITIFWYYRIYGTFPTESMFNSSPDFDNFDNQREAGIYEEENINPILFRDSVSRENLSAVKYFWKRLTDAQKLEVSCEEIFLDAHYDVIAIYLLGQMKFTYSPTDPTDCGPLWYLLGWPWVLFIDSWIDQYKRLNKYQFSAIFSAFIEQMMLEKETEGIEEMTERQSRGHLDAKYYVPCDKLWAICRENFDHMDHEVLAIISMIFYSGDIILCKIVMKGSTSSWRKVCLENMSLRRDFLVEMPSRDFCEKFMKEILVTDEERELFQGILNETSGDS